MGLGRDYILYKDKKLKGNPEHMVLLGSIRRQELIAAIEKQIAIRQDRRIFSFLL